MNLKSVEKQENGTAVLTIEVDAKAFDAAVEKVYRQNRNSIQLPGFRRGKAPRKLVEQMYGADIFYEDAVNSLYPDALEDATKEAELDTVGYPDVKVETLGAEGFTFVATVGLKPVPVLGEYKGITAVRTPVEVTEEDIDGEMFPLIRRATRHVTVERAAQNGDIAVIDFVGTRDGVPFEGGTGSDYELELGSGTFIPGFEEQVEGLSAGEEKDVNVTFPEDYGTAELAGAPAVFHVTVKEVKEIQKPVVDDDFAQDVSEYNTLAELRASLGENLKARREKNAQQSFEEAVLGKLIENTQMVIPDCMVEYEADRTMQSYERQFQGKGFTFDQYLGMMGMTRQQFRETAKTGALRQIQGDLCYTAVADAENIQPSDEEIEAQVQEMAEEYGEDAVQVREMISQENLVEITRIALAKKLVIDSAIAETPAEEKTGEESPAAAPVEEKPAKKKTTRKKPAKKTAPEEEPPVGETPAAEAPTEEKTAE